MSDTSDTLVRKAQGARVTVRLAESDLSRLRALAEARDEDLTAILRAASPDNAACEGFFGRLKTEMFCPRDWRSTTIEQFMQALDAYIRWYNEKRIKISLGFRSPVEYRESLGLAA